MPPSVDQGLSYDFVFWEGIPRRYQLYMPKQAFAHPDRPLPLIVDFHGMPILEEMRCVYARVRPCVGGGARPALGRSLGSTGPVNEPTQPYNNNNNHNHLP